MKLSRRPHAGLPWLPIAPSSPIPLYHQIALAIEGLILDGSLSEGTFLYETELVTRSRTSRPTVRKALFALAARGLATRETSAEPWRVPRLGARVADDKEVHRSAAGEPIR